MKRLLVTLLFPCVLMLSGTSQAFVGGIAVSIGRATNVEGAEIKPFSADAQIESEGHQMTSHVFYKSGKVRDEVNAGGMQMVVIQRYDEGKVWLLLGQGMYTEAEIGESEQAPDYKLIERTIVGKEDINGMSTTKYKTVYEGPKGRFVGLTWFTDDNIAVKGVMDSQANGEKQQLNWNLTNVQRGDQPDSLFELPPGAKPMSLLNIGAMGAMGNMGGTDATDGASSGQSSASAALGGLLSAIGVNSASESDTAADDSTDSEGTAGSSETDTDKSMQDTVTEGILGIFGR
ncbi:MAG: hypothetical protein R3E64_13720 [Halioglobus sp.]